MLGKIGWSKKRPSLGHSQDHHVRYFHAYVHKKIAKTV
jgi:hypothetical protein